MRIIRKTTIDEYISKYPTARASLERWLTIAEKAQWNNIQDLRLVFPSADPVIVKSGKTSTVFNVSGNNFRLITAIHYNTEIVFTLDFLTHAEYSKDTWKEEL